MNDKLAAEVEAHRLRALLRKRMKSIHFTGDARRDMTVAREIWESEAPQRAEIRQQENYIAMLKAAEAGEQWAKDWIRDAEELRRRQQAAARRKTGKRGTLSFAPDPAWQGSWKHSLVPTKAQAIKEQHKKMVTRARKLARQEENRQFKRKQQQRYADDLNRVFATLNIDAPRRRGTPAAPIPQSSLTRAESEAVASAAFAALDVSAPLVIPTAPKPAAPALEYEERVERPDSAICRVFKDFKI